MEDKVHYQLKRGVSLTVIPSKKFTVSQAVVNFSWPQTRENSTSRNMIVNLLSTASRRYPNQTAIARQLASLYGAALDSFVARVGQVHTVRFAVNWVNDRWTRQSLMEPVFDFLRELIFNPLLEDGLFDFLSWKLQSENLKAAYKSIQDDKQYYAAQQLMRLYYADGSPMQVPSSGSRTVLDRLQPERVMADYHSMLTNDQVDIIVVGDVDPEKVKEIVSSWPLADRSSLAASAFYYHQASYRQPLFEREEQDVSQAKLNMAYSLPVYYRDHQYLTAVVMNGLLGGSAYSLMFNNIREKESLAYYASSALRPFSGHLVVQTGINPATYQRVSQLIGDQIAMVRNGMFSDDQLAKVKNNLINQYLASSDSPSQQLEMALLNNLLVKQPEEHVVQKIQAVSRQQIADLASHLRLQASYLLTGVN